MKTKLRMIFLQINLINIAAKKLIILRCKNKQKLEITIAKV